jgi:hypothetical protein
MITEEKLARTREERLMLSWQTRSLAMVMAASGGNASEEVMKFAANLTIDNEEYAAFQQEGSGLTKVKSDPKVAVHATTQETEAQKNFDAAADSNSFEAFGMFGFALENGKPGQ